MAHRSVLARTCAALAALALALTACSGGSDAVDSTAGGQFHYVGATPRGTTIAVDKRKPAGPVHGQLLDSKTQFSLAAAKGKVVVLNFWNTDCAVCVVESPQLDKIYRRMKSKGIDFVGLDVADVSQGQAKSFVTDNDISYPIVYDQTSHTALELGKFPLVGLPDTIVIDRQGRVAAVYIGVVAQGDLDPVLAELAKSA